MGMAENLGRDERGMGLAMSREMATKIVNVYGQFVSTQAPMPGCVADASYLPYSKTVIKQALAVAILSTENAEHRKHFSNGYLMLSAWQKGVGPEHQGANFAALELDDDPMDTATTIEMQEANMARWNPVIEAEQHRLKRELEALAA